MVLLDAIHQKDIKEIQACLSNMKELTEESTIIDAAVMTNEAQILTLITEYGDKIGKKDQYHHQALIAAIYRHNRPLVQFLLAKGVNPLYGYPNSALNIACTIADSFDTSEKQPILTNLLATAKRFDHILTRAIAKKFSHNPTIQTFLIEKLPPKKIVCQGPIPTIETRQAVPPQDTETTAKMLRSKL